jgi:hypothetical protein
MFIFTATMVWNVVGMAQSDSDGEKEKMKNKKKKKSQKETSKFFVLMFEVAFTQMYYFHWYPERNF